ncbi:MAG: nuclear transport factor 2 family protein [Zoogloeaceae bacterium]|jgi:ketosteroid isomerase-like protein|nr:nuclear transport factor 2 family protein [Zoogloeaceae bacterium]
MTLSVHTFATPHDAEMAFYAAIRQRNLDALIAVWSDEEEVLCMHPGIPPLVSLDSIRKAWQEIFRRVNHIQLDVRHFAHWQGSLMSAHQLTEILRTRAGKEVRESTYRVTHLYIRGGHGWRLVCRHISSTQNGEAADIPSEKAMSALPRILH